MEGNGNGKEWEKASVGFDQLDSATVMSKRLFRGITYTSTTVQTTPPVSLGLVS